ncbi:protein GOS9-like [Carex rostrata]
MKVGPCGGDGGEMKDMNINGVTRILKVNIYYNKHIEALTITFLRDCLLESTEQWGIPEWGGSSTEILLQDSEYITSVKGHVDMSYIRSLKFETNLRSFGPYGREDQGTFFELPAITGQIIGFHGRAGKYLSALGVYVQDRDAGRVLEDYKQRPNI